jgi:hypothetical protein
MPEPAVKAAHANLSGVTFHASTRSLTDSIIKESSDPKEMEMKLGGRTAGGIYFSGGSRAGRMILDGESKHSTGASLQSKSDTAGTYAHEIGHAIDGPGYKHSGSAEWQEAFGEEIASKDSIGRHRLSTYAATKPQEGWAEFSRLVYGTDTDRGSIEKAFPKCSAYWKKHGFWQ